MNHDHSTTGNHNLHLWLMLACCLIPIALILAIGVFGISLGALTPLLPYALILLCPLMMFFMMRGTGDTHHANAPHVASAQQIADAPPGTVKSNPAPTQEQRH